MNKALKTLYKRISVLLILILPLNSFAAIVSDNDGSAFITKAEFDSLKNNFQSQIDQYNTSIDSKIDGAIASYLAGIRTSSIENMNILTNDWTEISCFNGIWEPTFQYPNVSIIYAGGFANDFSWSNWNKKFTMAFWRRYKYDRTNTNVNKSYRPLVTGNKETSQTTDMVWNGIANYYVESLESTLAFQTQGGADLAGIEAKGETKTLRFMNPCVYTKTGYLGDAFKSDTSILSASFKYKTSSKDYWNEITLSNKTASNNAIVELKTDKDDITKTYNHIIQLKADEEWPVSNELFTKTFRKYSKNTLKTSAWLNQTTKSGYNKMLVGHGQNYQSAGYYQNHYQESFFYYTNLTWSDTDDKNEILLSVGMLASDQKASSIYQFEKDKKYQFGKKTYDIKKPHLHEGFPLFYATKGTKCTWAPYFKKGKKKNDSGAWVDDGTTKVRLQLSVGPFKDKMTAADNSQIIKLKVNNSKEEVETAICKEEDYTTLKFELPKDGIVYAKWVQDDDSYESNKWIKTIDLEKCNIWSYEKDY
ncbi:MAG: hypothetical protein IKI71_02975 [Lachnospiraceae bacterium]|nr:hypothetical protein [Lachnospiraceae bacterium]